MKTWKTPCVQIEQPDGKGAPPPIEGCQRRSETARPANSASDGTPGDLGTQKMVSEPLWDTTAGHLDERRGLLTQCWRPGMGQAVHSGRQIVTFGGGNFGRSCGLSQKV